MSLLVFFTLLLGVHSIQKNIIMACQNPLQTVVATAMAVGNSHPLNANQFENNAPPGYFQCAVPNESYFVSAYQVVDNPTRITNILFGTCAVNAQVASNKINNELRIPSTSRLAQLTNYSNTPNQHSVDGLCRNCSFYSTSTDSDKLFMYDWQCQNPTAGNPGCSLVGTTNPATSC